MVFVFEVALYAFVPTERTTLRLFPYERKFAHVKNETNVFESGSPNTLTSVFSLSINFILFAFD